MSDYGDDDFEQYDEDEFEADEDYEVLPKGMAKPLAPAPQAPPDEDAYIRMSYTPEQAQARPASREMRPASGQRPLALPKAPTLTDEQRRAAVRRLNMARKKAQHVKLQVFAMDDMFTMASLSTYDLFKMARSCYSHLKTGSCQTNDDAKEEEVQTDMIEQRAHAAQVPDDRNMATDGGADAAGAAPRSVAARITSTDAAAEARLSSFLQWAGTVMLAALGLSPSSRNPLVLRPDPRGGQGLSAGVVTLQFDDLLAHRPVTAVAFNPGSEPLLLAAYNVVGAQLGAEELLSDHSLGALGVTCVWDLGLPTLPRQVLVSEGSPACCCWAPLPATNLVFAGMQEGGVCVWDLDEPQSRHPLQQVGAATLCLRRPCYTTEHLADVGSTAAPIVAVAAVSRGGGSRTTPCQLVTLSGWGNVCIYSVTVMADSSAAEIDLGMRLGSRVRLIRTATNLRLGMAALQPHGKAAVGAGGGGMSGGLGLGPQTFSLQVLPDQSNQFVVGADRGKVLRGSWAGLPSAPKELLADDHRSAAAVSPAASNLPSCVTALHCSPFLSKALLAGHDNGTVVLHSTETASAALVWQGTARGRVLAVRWSPSRPCVFFVLDALCVLHCFDLMQDRSGPVYSEPFMLSMPAPGGGHLASLTQCMDVGMMHQGSGSDALYARNEPFFAVGYDDGRVDVHAFSQRFSRSVQNEARVLMEIIGARMAKSSTSVAHRG